MRKLASVQTITGLEPIEGADRILAAQVMGWTVVVKKGEFAPGDRCVFFEVDAVLPPEPWAEFMAPREYRVKTCRLRGVLSQGLALPISILPDGEYAEGDELTERLGVHKYEPPPPRGIDAIGPFPSFLPRTDELRLQSAMHLLDELRGRPYVMTVKLDGMSMTAARLDDELQVCGRNQRLAPGNNAYWDVAQALQLDPRLPEGYAIQGELCGPKIQKNRLGLEGLQLFVFDVFEIRRGRYLDVDAMRAFCADADLATVPLEDRGDALELDLAGLLERARGRYAGTRNRREGLVVRPPAYARASSGDRLSFKVLNNEFLLKDED